MIFSKAILLTFLTLGLVAHANPHQDRAQQDCTDPADVSTPSKASSNSTTQNPVTGKGQSKDKNGNKNSNSGKGQAGQVGKANNTSVDTNQKNGVSKDAANKGQTKDNGNNKTASNDVAKGNQTQKDANNNPQTSLCLDSSVIGKGFALNGQQNQTEPNQVASLTSTNNFINFCALSPQQPITNGQQVKTGSCNPVPMGLIPSTTNMPTSKFSFPANLATVKANQSFNVTMAIENLETGNFVNAESNYYAAPQQLNGQGQIIGHSHIVIQKLDSIQSTKLQDPTGFAFFKGLNDAAVNGILSAEVTGGLPAGSYRVSSINTAANHQPALVPVAQHAALDDMVYFTVTQDGNPSTDSANGNNNNGKKAGTNNKAADNGKAGNTTDTTSSNKSSNTTQQSTQQKDSVNNGKANNTTSNTSDKSSGTSQSQQSTQQKANKGDAAKKQQPSYTPPGNRRRLFRLEVRKDIY